MRVNKLLSSNYESVLSDFNEFEDQAYNTLYELSGFDRKQIKGVHTDGYSPADDPGGLAFRLTLLSLSIDMAQELGTKNNLCPDNYTEGFAKLRGSLDSFVSHIKELTTCQNP